MNVVRGDLPDRLAAEYVLGTLQGGARRRFDALVPAHPSLREAVSRWERTLLPMALRAEPVTPSPQAWSRLEARLGWSGGAAAPAGATSTAAGGRPRATGLLRFWQSVAAVATMVAVVMGTMVRTGPAAPPLVVVLKSTGAGAATTLVAGVSPDRQGLSIRPLQPVALASDRSLELWAVPQGRAPVSLGVISAQGLTAVQRHALPKDTRQLAVSVEPVGGSTTGQPTGPIVFVGDLTL